jgi:hypothetical protein
VIELMVTSKPTTEGSGASSPVTKTDACCEVGDVGVDELDDEPQLAANRQSASKTVIPKHRFMANSNSRIFVKAFWGSSDLLHDDGNTLDLGMSRNLRPGYRMHRGKGEFAMWWGLSDLRAAQAGAAGVHVL